LNDFIPINEQGEEFNPRQKLAVLRRYRSLLILFCLSAMLFSLILTYIYQERYRATTTIIYRPTQSVRFQASEFQSMGFPMPLLPFEAIGYTIGQVGKSESVMREVVQRLHLDRVPANDRTGFSYCYHETKRLLKGFIRNTKSVLKHGRIIERNPTSAAIEELARNTELEVTSQDYTAKINVIDKDPQRAAKIVDVLGDVLVRVLREESIKDARAKRQEAEGVLAAKKAELDDIRTGVEKLKLAHQFVSLKEEISLNLRSVDQFERDLRKNEEKLSACRAKLQMFKAQRELLKPMIESSKTETDDPLYMYLRNIESDREVKRKGLLERYFEDHPDVLTLDAEIKAVEKTLNEIEEKRISSQITSLNEVHRKILADELEVEAQIEGLEAAVAALKDVLADQKTRFGDPGVESQMNELILDLEVRESAYKQLATVCEEARIAELQSLSEIRVLHKATPQDMPIRPIKVYHVVLSGILALILGVGVAYFVDYWRSLSPGGCFTSVGVGV